MTLTANQREALTMVRDDTFCPCKRHQAVRSLKQRGLIVDLGSKDECRLRITAAGRRALEGA